MAKSLQHHGSSSQTPDASPSSGQPTDIIELVMADHRRIRRLFGALEDTNRWSSASGSGWMPAHVWERLAGLIEGHTRAEEEICYLAMFGCQPRAAEFTREAIADHDDIRAAIGEASLQRAGSALWWRAVRAVAAISGDHLNREECEVLAESLPRLTTSRRRELGRQWRAFLAAWTLDTAPRAGAQRACAARGDTASSLIAAAEAGLTPAVPSWPPRSIGC